MYTTGDARKKEFGLRPTISRFFQISPHFVEFRLFRECCDSAAELPRREFAIILFDESEKEKKLDEKDFRRKRKDASF